MPDLVWAALEKAGDAADDGAVLVGDTPRDVRAAERAVVATLAVLVLTGGLAVQS